MKEAKRTQITEAICKQAQLMRKGGANQTEIGKLLGVNPCTISRIEKAGFDFKQYQELLKERRAKERKQAEEPEKAEELQGQIEMDLTETKPEGDWRKDFIQSEQTRMMRFQAHMTDDLKKTIIDMIAIVTVNQNKLYDMVCQLIRAVRKE